MFWQSVEDLEAEKERLREDVGGTLAQAGRLSCLLRWGCERMEDDDFMVARRIGDVALLLWIWAFLAMDLGGWNASWDAFVAYRRLWCVWQGCRVYGCRRNEGNAPHWPDTHRVPREGGHGVRPTLPETR